MLPCCPQTPKTQGWSRGFLHSLLLPISKNTSVGKASAVCVADSTRIPVWEARRPWRDGKWKTPILQGEVRSGLSAAGIATDCQLQAGSFAWCLCHSSVPSAITTLKLSSSWPEGSRETHKDQVWGLSKIEKYSWRFQQALSQAQSS